MALWGGREAGQVLMDEWEAMIDEMGQRGRWGTEGGRGI